MSLVGRGAPGPQLGHGHDQLRRAEQGQHPRQLGRGGAAAEPDDLGPRHRRVGQQPGERHVGQGHRLRGRRRDPGRAGRCRRRSSRTRSSGTPSSSVTRPPVITQAGLRVVRASACHQAKLGVLDREPVQVDPLGVHEPDSAAGLPPRWTPCSRAAVRHPAAPRGHHGAAWARNSMTCPRPVTPGPRRPCGAHHDPGPVAAEQVMGELDRLVLRVGGGAADRQQRCTRLHVEDHRLVGRGQTTSMRSTASWAGCRTAPRSARTPTRRGASPASRGTGRRAASGARRRTGCRPPAGSAPGR